MNKFIITTILFFCITQAFSQRIAILGSPANPTWNDEVKSTLQTCSNFDVIDIHNISIVTPSLAQLNTYDAVLVYSDSGISMPSALGDNLADYVDAGGRVVLAVFANASVTFSGRFVTDNYYVIQPSGQSAPGNLQLGTIHDPSSALLQNVTTFNGGSSSYYSVGALHPSAISVADYSNGAPFIATRLINGVERVDLNFYPPSEASRSDFWLQSTDGCQIMANALNPVDPEPVPTLSEWSILILGLSLTIFGVVSIKSKKLDFSFE